MAAPLLEITGLQKSFGALQVTSSLSLDLREGEVHALIGPNGAGKSSLIAQISGELEPDAGTIKFQGEDITTSTAFRRALSGISRSYQITSVFPEYTVLQNVVVSRLAQTQREFGFFRRALADPTLTGPAEEAIRSVGLTARLATPAGVLAHGERRQLELAMALVAAPKLLVLDEPMAGMSRRESSEMVELLRSLKGRCTMLLVEHDMDAVFELADRISVLVQGQIIATDTPAAIRSDARVIAAYLGEPSAA